MQNANPPPPRLFYIDKESMLKNTWLTLPDSESIEIQI